MVQKALKYQNKFSIFAQILNKESRFIQRFVLLLIGLTTMSLNSLASKPSKTDFTSSIEIIKEIYLIDSVASSIYADLNVEELNFFIFLEAYHGYINYSNEGLIENEKVMTIIDFDKTSNEKRFFVVDMEEHKVLFNSYVAHGQKTGELKAERFSNRVNSHQSSIGFYITDNTYFGKHGLSLRLDGLEKGLNDKARERNIVVHSADYVSEEYIDKNKRLGRSWGCPALPSENYEEVIAWIKDKSLLFIYSSSSN
jgi:hypothetical protein